jgi:cyanate lyase
MNRQDVTDKIGATKRARGLTWRAIAAAIARDASPIFTTAALFGQMRLTADEAQRAADLLGLSAEEAQVLTEVPYRGALPPGPPTDPLIYRLHELVSVYGTTLKALIEEEFGDGIMSAIDFEMTLDRVPDPKGDRVQLTLNGKFLPYRRY